MSVLPTLIDRGSPGFAANAAHNAALGDDLRARIARTAPGGPERSRERHVARGKLLPRDRIHRLLDAGSPFLEIGALAATAMYGDEAPAAGVIAGIGRIHLYICASSGRPGWPETCTCAWRSVIITTPLPASVFWILPIATSLPGICLDEKITVSPMSSLIVCDPSATRARAARGSPWPPVATIRILFLGRRIAASGSTVSGKSVR